MGQCFFLGPKSENFKSKIKNLTKLNSLEKNLILGPLKEFSLTLLTYLSISYLTTSEETKTPEKIAVKFQNLSDS